MKRNRFFTLIAVFSLIGCSETELDNSNIEENNTEETQNPSNLTWNKIGQTIEGSHVLYRFGYNLALNSDGEKIIIGMLGEDKACNYDPICKGTANIYQQQDNNWVQINQTLYGATTFDQFGYDVGISNDGNKIVVGSAKFSYSNKTQSIVYENNQNEWKQIGEEKVNLDSSLYEKVMVDISGSGNIFAFGSRNRIKIYQKENQSWVQIGNSIEDVHRKINSMSMNSDGNVIAIGYTGYDYIVKIFQIIGNSWIQVGQNIRSEVESDNFGISLKLNNNGSTLAIGALEGHCNGGCESSAGYVKVYQNKGNEWIQKGQKLVPLKEGHSVYLGKYIGIDGTGNKIAIGLNKIKNNSKGVFSFAVVFEFNTENEWQQLGNTIAEDIDRRALYSIDLSKNGNTVAIATGDDLGKVEVFRLE